MRFDDRYRPEHKPQGNPCARCHEPEALHRARPCHPPVGDPCTVCGHAAARHRAKYKHGMRGEGRSEEGKKRDRQRRREKQKERRKKRFFIGVDGEGQGCNPHRYVLLAWSNADGSRTDKVHNPQGLSTEECLEFLLRIPNRARAFTYGFNYDLTKILADLDNESLYLLFRPELRRREKAQAHWGPAPVRYKGYVLNLQGTRFSVRRIKRRGQKKLHTKVLWDVVRFFQDKFVGALTKWKVGEKETVDRMAAMKDRRADFDQLDMRDVEAYCFSECAGMAALVEKLVTAHENAGIHLTKFYGAGSTASLLLKKLGVGSKKRQTPDMMRGAVASAFFGGRFEHSVIGPVEVPCYGYDIASAYPYACTQLVCLDCGAWRYTRKRRDLDKAQAACVRYTLGRPPKGITWAPFPFRLKDGSICFPAQSDGGWVWFDEYLAGEALFAHVQFQCAWIYETACTHRPFERVPEWYKERLKLGKEGPGIVLKLGMNSLYGKLAQSIGLPPFQCWIWAGMITSFTRAQILALLSVHKDRRNMLAVATDGVYTKEELTVPHPVNTGTFDACDVDGVKKPLGSWEKKAHPEGLFFFRPGLYFDLGNKTEAELKALRARGVGRAVMAESRGVIRDAWEKRQSVVELPALTRFVGAKTGTTRRGWHDPNTGESGYSYHRSDDYGQWVQRDFALSFSPLPKRARATADGRLLLRRVSGVSLPYDPAIVSPEALVMRQALDEAVEQPDGGDGDNLIQYGPET